jgi:hypothetical protein
MCGLIGERSRIIDIDRLSSLLSIVVRAGVVSRSCFPAAEEIPFDIECIMNNNDPIALEAHHTPKRFPGEVVNNDVYITPKKGSPRFAGGKMDWEIKGNEWRLRSL